MALTVFLCDDAEGYRTLVRTVLEEDDDLRVVGEAADGGECIDKVPHGTAPDVILLDVNMPALGGRSAIPGLQARVPDAAIVMLSTAPAAEMEAECLRLGARAYIQKPMDVFSLPGLLRSALA